MCPGAIGTRRPARCRLRCGPSAPSDYCSATRLDGASVVTPGLFQFAGIPRGIGHPGLRESLAAQAAGVAHTAGAPVSIGLVAAHGLAVVDAEFDATADDLRLRQMLQRCVDAEIRTFDAGAGGEVGHALEGLDELGAAAGIAGIIDG